MLVVSIGCAHFPRRSPGLDFLSGKNCTWRLLGQLNRGGALTQLCSFCQSVPARFGQTTWAKGGASQDFPQWCPFGPKPGLSSLRRISAQAVDGISIHLEIREGVRREWTGMQYRSLSYSLAPTLDATGEAAPLRLAPEKHAVFLSSFSMADVVAHAWEHRQPRRRGLGGQFRAGKEI